MPQSVMQLFEQTGAYLRGHFRLTSGLHSGEYLQCAKVLAYPAYAQEFGEQLANRLRPILPARGVSGGLARDWRNCHRP